MHRAHPRRLAGTAVYLCASKVFLLWCKLAVLVCSAHNLTSNHQEPRGSGRRDGRSCVSAAFSTEQSSASTLSGGLEKAAPGHRAHVRRTQWGACRSCWCFMRNAARPVSTRNSSASSSRHSCLWCTPRTMAHQPSPP